MRVTLNHKVVLLLTAFALLFNSTLFAQTAQDHFLNRYKIGVELFQKGMLHAAEVEFEALLEENYLNKEKFTSDIQAYLTLIAIESNHANRDAKYSQMEKQWSNSSLISIVRLRFASELFDIEQYNQAIEIYNKINIKNLSKTYRNEYYFKKG